MSDLKNKGESGQMTVELAAALPVLIIVAVIAVNALQFMATCASFDRLAHDAVRVHAASPAYSQSAEQNCAAIGQRLKAAYEGEGNMEVEVVHATVGVDYDEYTATVKYFPTLFGLGLRSEVLGVPLPSLSHSTRFVVDTYKPGVVV